MGTRLVRSKLGLRTQVAGLRAFVIPAKAGIQTDSIDPRFRGNNNDLYNLEPKSCDLSPGQVPLAKPEDLCYSKLYVY